MNQGFGHLSYGTPTLEQTWKSAFTNNSLEIKVIFSKYNDISGDRIILVVYPNYKIYEGPFVPVVTDHAGTTFKATYELSYILMCLPSERHPNSWFPQLKHPRFTKENFTNYFVSSIK